MTQLRTIIVALTSASLLILAIACANTNKRGGQDDTGETNNGTTNNGTTNNGGTNNGGTNNGTTNNGTTNNGITNNGTTNNGTTNNGTTNNGGTNNGTTNNGDDTLATCQAFCTTLAGCEVFTTACGENIATIESVCREDVCVDTQLQSALVGLSGQGCEAASTVLEALPAELAALCPGEPCTDACDTDGATRCSATGDVESCAIADTGCLDWSLSADCTDTQTCDDSGDTALCAETCTDACDTGGATRCNATGDVETCAIADTGCMDWIVSADCMDTQTCDDGGAVATCVDTCMDACAGGATQCSASGDVETCDVVGTGCRDWVVSDDCTDTERCDEGSGMALCVCVDACVEGTSRCSAAGDVEVCAVDPGVGCTAWTLGQDCAPNDACDDSVDPAVCVPPCADVCDAEGALQCSSDGAAVEICAAQSSGCLDWQVDATCGAMEVCSVDACVDTTAHGIYRIMSGLFDVAGRSWTFTPTASGDYALTRGPAGTTVTFPDAPHSGTAGSTALSLSDDDFIEYSLTSFDGFTFYGVEYTSFFVGSNGYVTFGQGSTGRAADLAAFFTLPRIAALLTDLDPGATGAEVVVDQFPTHVTISWVSVPRFTFGTAGPNDLQIMLWADGRIDIHAIRVAADVFPNSYAVGIGDGDPVDSGIYPSPSPLAVNIAGEPDGTPSEAQPIVRDAVALVRGMGEGDVDWYTFTLDATTTVTIETMAVPAGFDVDTRIWLCNVPSGCSHAGNNLAANDDISAPENLYSRLEAVELTAGSYTIGVDGQAGSTGDYAIRLSTFNAGPYEPNDHHTLATPINLGEPLTAAIELVGDQDWFRFTLAAPTTLDLETRDPMTADPVDTVIFICDDADPAACSRSNALASDDDGAAPYSAITGFSLQAGTYYLVVIAPFMSGPGPTGDYIVSVAAQ